MSNEEPSTENKKSGLRIFYKVLLGYLIIPLIPIVGLIYMITLSESELTNFVRSNLEKTSSIIAENIVNWSDKNLRTIKILSELEGIKSMRPREQIDILNTAKNNIEWATVLFVTDKEGNAIARPDSHALLNYADRSYFRDVINGEAIGQSVVMGKIFPTPLHCLSVPIKQVISLVGVLNICSKLIDISNHVTSTKIGKTGFAFLVDDKNKLIAHGSGNRKLIDDLEDFSNHPAIRNKDSNEIIEYEEFGRKIIAYSRNIGLGWTLVVQQDYDEAYSSTIEAKRNAIILLAVTIILTLVLAIALSRGISNPIQNLTAITTAYSNGKFDNPIPELRRADEIGDLARATQRMGVSIRIAMRQIQRKR